MKKVILVYDKMTSVDTYHYFINGAGIPVRVVFHMGKFTSVDYYSEDMIERDRWHLNAAINEVITELEARYACSEGENK